MCKSPLRTPPVRHCISNVALPSLKLSEGILVEMLPSFAISVIPLIGAMEVFKRRRN